MEQVQWLRLQVAQEFAFGFKDNGVSRGILESPPCQLFYSYRMGCCATQDLRLRAQTRHVLVAG